MHRKMSGMNTKTQYFSTIHAVIILAAATTVHALLLYRVSIVGTLFLIIILILKVLLMKLSHRSSPPQDVGLPPWPGGLQSGRNEWV